MSSKFNCEQFQVGASLLRRENEAPLHHLREPRSESWAREAFPHRVSNHENEHTKIEKSVLRFVGRLRVLGSCPYLVGIEYSWVLQVVKVSERSDKFHSGIFGF